jgi:hypothetical protein
MGRITAMIMSGMILTAVAAGCASEPDRTPTSKEVRTDSDRFFDKMKQDERDRTKGTSGGGY